jgi:hypothetical protein
LGKSTRREASQSHGAGNDSERGRERIAGRHAVESHLAQYRLTAGGLNIAADDPIYDIGCALRQWF